MPTKPGLEGVGIRAEHPSLNPDREEQRRKHSSAQDTSGHGTLGPGSSQGPMPVPQKWPRPHF